MKDSDNQDISGSESIESEWKSSKFRFNISFCNKEKIKEVLNLF